MILSRDHCPGGSNFAWEHDWGWKCPVPGFFIFTTRRENC
jgi:hypothetical protein